MSAITFGVLTVSDRCHRGETDDIAGAKLVERILEFFPEAKIIYRKIVPDDFAKIEDALHSWSLSECNVILTTGGTGFSTRDITPEATRAVIDREAPGLAYAMISRSLAVTEMAMLSRAVCGIKLNTLIVNLPGSAKGAQECFDFIKNSIRHAVALLTDNIEVITTAHKSTQGVSEESKDNSELIMGDHKLVYSVPKEIMDKSKVRINRAAERNRSSPYPLLEVEDAFKLMLTQCAPTVEIETVNVENSLNRILAEDVYAQKPIPEFPTSVKDGYAVRSLDGMGERNVINISAAGDEINTMPQLKVNEVVRISTGAIVPPSADAVVQVEDTTLVKASPDGSEELVIRINTEVRRCQDIRITGSDVSANSLVLVRKDRISPAHIGVMASLGKTKVQVYKRHSVGILSTGNELRGPHEGLRLGQIYDSNKLTLMNLLKQYSYESNDCGIARDDPDSVKNCLEDAFENNDIVISTGGVSMGEFDVIKQVLSEDFNALIHFGRINMKPGKPTTFATLSYNGKPKIVFGLPGNPVSSSVTSLLFVIPLLRYLERSNQYEYPMVTAYLEDDVRNKDERPEYVRVSLTFKGYYAYASSTGNQMSSRLNSMVGANGLLLLPGNTDFCTKGGKYPTIIL